MVSSTIMLLIYLGFIFFEQMLYSSNSFEPVVPWGSFERTLAMVRILLKIIISAGFTFDKAGQYRGLVNIICFFVQAFIVFRRYQSAVIFDTLIFYTTIMLETLQMWLYITVGIHLIFNQTLNLSSLALIFLIGLFFGACLVII